MAGTTGVVQGKNCVFQVNFGTGYLTLVCAKSFGVTIDTEMKEITSKGSGVFKEYDYKALSYRISLSGLIKAVDLDDDPIFFDLANYQKGFLPLEYKAIFTDNNAVVKVIRGIAIVQTSAFNASAGQLADSTVELQGSGEYYIDSDSGAGCSNSVSGATINGIALEDGDNLGIANTADLNITIDSLTNPAIQIFRYDYEIDSNGRNSAFSDSTLPFAFSEIEMEDIVPGSHTLTIWPICDNGESGGSFVINLSKSTPD